MSLTAFDRWAVASNLRAIREEGADPVRRVATVRANGYPEWADAIEAELAVDGAR
jgi:hypothetical protein